MRGAGITTARLPPPPLRDEYFRMKLQWKSVSPEQERRNSLLHGYRSLIGGWGRGGTARRKAVRGQWGGEQAWERRGTRSQAPCAQVCHLLTVRSWPGTYLPGPQFPHLWVV